MINPFLRKPTPETDAPIKVMLELWPAAFKGRATIVRDGKTSDLEISAAYMPAILNFLRLAGIL